jgi:pyruvate/oxaloacetate carboxyltransferase
MLKSKELKKKIIKHIEKMPADKLNNVWKYVKNADKRERKKDDILTYAGCWKDLDKEVLDNLTIYLGKNRMLDRRKLQ